eukprot:55149-Chlamydomonas_euryale.AAC.9
MYPSLSLSGENCKLEVARAWACFGIGVHSAPGSQNCWKMVYRCSCAVDVNSECMEHRAVAGMGKLSLPVLMAIFITAAILGDMVNYAIGDKFGRIALDRGIISKDHINKTEK